LLLNVPPDRSGLLSRFDVDRLMGMRRELDRTFGKDLAAGARITRRRPSPTSALAIVNLPRAQRINLVDLREEIEGGQVIARYKVEGNIGRSWKILSQGTTIGNRKLDRFEPVTVKSVRVTVEDAVGIPRPLKIGLYGG
jgi:alpha-L-fucosidase